MKTKTMYQIYDPEGNELYEPFQTLDGATYMAKYYAPEGSTVVEVELLIKDEKKIDWR